MGDGRDLRPGEAVAGSEDVAVADAVEGAVLVGETLDDRAGLHRAVLQLAVVGPLHAVGGRPQLPAGRDPDPFAVGDGAQEDVVVAAVGRLVGAVAPGLAAVARDDADAAVADADERGDVAGGIAVRAGGAASCRRCRSFRRLPVVPAAAGRAAAAGAPSFRAAPVVPAVPVVPALPVVPAAPADPCRQHPRGRGRCCRQHPCCPRRPSSPPRRRCRRRRDRRPPPPFPRPARRRRSRRRDGR